MSEFSEDEPLEDRLRRLMHRIDDLSHEASAAASERFSSVSEDFSSRMEEMGKDLKQRHEGLRERSAERRAEKKRVVRDTAPPVVDSIKGVEQSKVVEPIPTGLMVYSEPKPGLMSKISTAFFNHMQYTFPAIILFSSVIWIGYYAETTIAGRFLESFSDVTGISKSAFSLLFFWGWLPGVILTFPLFSGSEAQLTGILDLVSLMFILGSIGFIYRIRLSPVIVITALGIALVGRIAIPLQEGAILADLAILELLTILLFTILFGFLLTLPRFPKNESTPAEIGLQIDHEILASESDNESEASKQAMEFLWYDSDMSDPTDTLPRPKRPRGRSEYEMYEWVLLLVNLVLWPISIISTMVVGANTEFMGMGPFNFDENWLLLIGAWAPTAFFFYLLYRMDAAARDGQTYHMEKVGYQEAMTRYTEAKNAYLELLTLKAEVRKQEIIDENPSLDLGSTPRPSE
ncbi:MAG: hypothetical protein L7S54_00255 [Candidatus Thalassarchaeaceae archaeon]|nr:hypothetical protein [Candidatus Thalassarchaeaceae archaeon]